jgi:hypothetical protein
MTDAQRATIDAATIAMRDAMRTFIVTTLPPLATAVQTAGTAAGGFPTNGGLETADSAFYLACARYVTGLNAGTRANGAQLPALPL